MTIITRDDRGSKVKALIYFNNEYLVMEYKGEGLPNCLGRYLYLDSAIELYEQS